MTQLSFAESLRDRGMHQALSHSNREHCGWSEQAIEMIQSYPEQEFMSEDLRKWLLSQGLPEPASHNAWGGVIKAADNRGLIQFVRYEKCKHPEARARVSCVWRKV